MDYSERRAVIAKNIMEQVEKKGYDRSTLAKEINVPYTTVCDWLKQRTSPRIEKLNEMANKFECTISDLVEPHDPAEAPIKLEVLGSLNESNVNGFIYASKSEIPDGRIVGMRIQGDSMTPLLCDGDTVLVVVFDNWQTEAQTGDIVIATVNGDITCKKFQKDEDGGITLIPANEKYRSVHYSDEDVKTGYIAIYGKVVEIRRKIS